MSMKPILFNTEMVKALLEGRKTVTRRLVKNKDIINAWDCEADGSPIAWIEPGTGDSYAPTMPCRYQPGDILYVRETFTEDGGRYYYRADFESDWLDPCETLSGGYPAACRYRNCDTCCAEGERIHWRPSIHMPKEAARIFLRVKRVSVERLQAITEADAQKEGCEGLPCDHPGMDEHGCVDCLNTGWLEPPSLAFMELWDSTIKPADLATYGWKANPWVWVIEFERWEKPKEVNHGNS
jgi:hypothetical protein